MEFSRQEYWSGLPFPVPGDLPHWGISPPRSPALQADSLPSESPRHTDDSWQGWGWLSKCTVLSIQAMQMKLWFKIIVFESSLVAQMVKSLPAMRDTWIQSLGQEDFLEKGIATHSSILACKILWMEDPGGPQSMALQRVRHDWATNTHKST